MKLNFAYPKQFRSHARAAKATIPTSGALLALVLLSVSTAQAATGAEAGPAPQPPEPVLPAPSEPTEQQAPTSTPPAEPQAPSGAQAKRAERETIDPGFIDAGGSEEPSGRDREDRERDTGSGSGALMLKTSVVKKAFFKGKKPATLTLEAADKRGKSSGSGGDAKIDLVSVKTGKRIESWKVELDGKGPYKVRWKGTEKGKLAKPGKYEFRISTPDEGDGSAKAATAAKKGGGSGGKAFDFYTDHFPLPAKHQYGDGFGAGRDHKGQDVFADCGEELVASRGGKVQANQYQKEAGFYLVIDGAKTEIDYFYAHMKKASKLKAGDKVKTGEAIGINGESGNADGCHVHYEMWKGGWYEGGKPFSPTKDLKSWDDYS